MKPLKAAAVVAGSLVVTGVTAPAFADDASGLTPTSLNAAVQTLATQKSIDIRPLAHQSDTLDTENKDSLLSTLKGTTAVLNQHGTPARLLGGLPLRGR